MSENFGHEIGVEEQHLVWLNSRNCKEKEQLLSLSCFGPDDVGREVQWTFELDIAAFHEEQLHWHDFCWDCKGTVLIIQTSYLSQNTGEAELEKFVGLVGTIFDHIAEASHSACLVFQEEMWWSASCKNNNYQ